MSEQSKNKAFAALFKKYRLRSEIESLSEFCNLFAEEGMTYENSLFTRWQNGERVPRDRRVVLTMIKLFVKRGGINSADEANMILESVDLRDLSNEEIDELQNMFRISEVSQGFYGKQVLKGTIATSRFYICNLKILQFLTFPRHLFLIYSFILISVIWLLLDPKNQKYIGNAYVTVAFIGALIGIQISNKFGRKTSYFGLSIFNFSLGLLAQVFGQMVYTYYIVLKDIQIPYPSIGDIGYFGTIPLYTAGVMYLAKALGVKIVLRSYSQALGSIFLPILMLIITYAHLLYGYQFSNTSILTVLLDFGYPLGQAIHISIALLILSLTKGVFGEMKNKIRFIILALISQYLSDYVFIYQANEGIWITGGFNDYMYFISYFLMSLAILQFSNIPHTLQLRKR